MDNMLKYSELNLGFNDAKAYLAKDNKDFFNRIFLSDDNTIEKLLDSSIYFLLGEKGTGKTAFAVYLSNNTYKNYYSSLKNLQATDYKSFINLKNNNCLSYSAYNDVWTVILYLMIAQKVIDDEKDNIFSSKFQDLRKAIDNYYNNAFIPEIQYAIQFIENSKLAAELISKCFHVSIEDGAQISFDEKRIQMNLLYIKKQFEEAFRSLKLSKNHILFVDGIDTRSDDVEFSEYLDCIKGLANAVCYMNDDFFRTIKDSKGRLKIVLLLRPDIFDR